MTKPPSIKPLRFSLGFSGDVVPWVRLTGAIRELFDVAVLPGAAAPMSVGGVDGTEAHVTWEAEVGKLFPDTPKGKAAK